MQYAIIKLEAGTTKPKIVPLESSTLDIQTLYEMVDCNIFEFAEPLQFNQYMGAIGERFDYLMCIDDNGKLSHKPINTIASEMYVPLYDLIVGNAIIGRRERISIEEPDFYALDMEEAQKLYNNIKEYLYKRFSI